MPGVSCRSGVPMAWMHFLFLALAMLGIPISSGNAQEALWPEKTHYRYQDVLGRRIFYREAGRASKPVLLLLHGYPSSSHTYRELIPLLSGRFRVIAPDYLGAGYSDRPDPEAFAYSFDVLTDYVEGLVNELGIGSYVLYMQDFGAPVGYRLMMRQPEKLRGLIVQNANAYLEGLTEKRREFFKSARDDQTDSGIAKVFAFTSRTSIVESQYLRDVRDRVEIMSPDSWTHDLAFLRSDRDRKIQVQLFQDYYNNLLAYPQWQAFLRSHQPPTLIVWGKNDPAFISPGAKAYLRDLPNAELHLLDAGHFAVEEMPVTIAKYVTNFVSRLPQ